MLLVSIRTFLLPPREFLLIRWWSIDVIEMRATLPCQSMFVDGHAEDGYTRVGGIWCGVEVLGDAKCCRSEDLSLGWWCLGLVSICWSITWSLMKCTCTIVSFAVLREGPVLAMFVVRVVNLVSWHPGDDAWLLSFCLEVTYPIMQWSGGSCGRGWCCLSIWDFISWMRRLVSSADTSICEWLLFLEVGQVSQKSKMQVEEPSIWNLSPDWWISHDC